MTGSHNDPARVFYEVTAFIKIGREQHTRPQSIGFAYQNADGTTHVKLHLLPILGSGWDGTLKIEPQRRRDDLPTNDSAPPRQPHNGNGDRR